MGDLFDKLAIPGVLVIAGFIGTLKFYKYKIDEQATRCDEKHRAYFGANLAKMQSDLEYTMRVLGDLHHMTADQSECMRTISELQVLHGVKIEQNEQLLGELKKDVRSLLGLNGK